MTWLVIVVVGSVTMAFKAAGPVLLGNRELPSRVASVVDVLAPAMLAALVVTQTVGGDRELVDRPAAGRGHRRRGRRLAAGAVARRDARRGGHGRRDPPVLGSLEMPRVEEMVERVWPGRDARIETLGGGITNRNFKVSVDGGVYVLRIGGRDTELLGIDRRAEHEASLAAAAVGVGPEVVSFLEPEGYLVTRFLEGTVVVPEAIREPEPLRWIAHALRAIHSGPPIPARFDSFRVVEAYAATAAAHGIAVPSAFERARDLAAKVERARGPVPERPCHNDLLTSNLIDDGTRIRIVDWEYAGMGDIYFDLANFAVNNGLPGAGHDRAAARLLRRCDARARTRADADALHVRLPRGDVGRRPAGSVGPGLRLRAPTRSSTSSGSSEPPPSARSGARWASYRFGRRTAAAAAACASTRDGRNDLEGRVHRHENAYRQRPDTA